MTFGKASAKQTALSGTGKLRWTALLTATTLIAASCGTIASISAVEPNAAGEVQFVLTDNSISPSVVRVKAGQRVRFIITNEGRHLHEFMVGRETVASDNYLVDEVIEAFGVDFFAELDVSVAGGMPMNFEGMDAMEMGDGEAMDMGDGETMGDGEAMDMGDDETMEEGDGEAMDMGDDEIVEGGGEEPHTAAMVMLQPGSVSNNEPGEVTVIEFTVPEDRVGTWQIGCFQEAGQHWEDGMRATLIVDA